VIAISRPDAWYRPAPTSKTLLIAVTIGSDQPASDRHRLRWKQITTRTTNTI